MIVNSIWKNIIYFYANQNPPAAIAVGEFWLCKNAYVNVWVIAYQLYFTLCTIDNACSFVVPGRIFILRDIHCISPSVAVRV